MRKALLLIISVLFFTGCNQKNDQARVSERATDVGKTSHYSDEKYNVSFDYPSNWKIAEDEGNGHAVSLISANNGEVYFNYQSESFEEYEDNFRDLPGPYGVSIKEIHFADDKDYSAREYGMEGAVNYIIETDGKYIMFSTENGLSPEQKEGIEDILNSLSL